MAGDEGNEDRAARERRRRSWAIALVLGGLVILFFVMTIVRLGIRFGH
ncbi:MAG TPA: hypothetical protein VL286_06815 [Rhizomicrobium sp.]|jgi:hypothetical protein|nr:hypothetical protein [Rhizomicrobium sp.]